MSIRHILAFVISVCDITGRKRATTAARKKKAIQIESDDSDGESEGGSDKEKSSTSVAKKRGESIVISHFQFP